MVFGDAKQVLNSLLQELRELGVGKVDNRRKAPVLTG